MNPNINLSQIGNLTTPFGGSTKGETFHPGLDIANRPGSPIPAFADGTIQSVGPTSNGMGNIVTLKDVGGNTHQYSHLQKANVKPGQRVKKGQTLGGMGSTGGTSYSPSGGNADHLDIRISNAYGKYMNPMAYLKNR